MEDVSTFASLSHIAANRAYEDLLEETQTLLSPMANTLRLMKTLLSYQPTIV
jgi:hypothetical protein